MTIKDGRVGRDITDAGTCDDWTILQEQGYSVRIIDDPEKIIEAYRLRHDVFTDALGWVSRTECGLELDCYDEYAVSFGVYDSYGQLLAYIRLLLPDGRFMLEDVFSSLLTPGYSVLKESGYSEVSRLCIAQDARNIVIRLSLGKSGILMLLIKGLYRWCSGNGIRFVYAVAEDKICRYYRSKGLPLINLGGALRMPDGVLSRAVLLDWRNFEHVNASLRPKLLEWYRTP